MNIFCQKIIIEGCLLFKMYNECKLNGTIIFINIIINNTLDNKYNINIIMHNNKYIVQLFIFRCGDWWNSLIM